jgi:hypothetical protein
MNSFSLISQTVNESTGNTLDDVSDVTRSTNESETFPSFFFSSSPDDFDLSTLSNEILFRQDQWFNVNQSHRGDQFSFWRQINGKTKRFLLK